MPPVAGITKSVCAVVRLELFIRVREKQHLGVVRRELGVGLVQPVVCQRAKRCRRPRPSPRLRCCT